MSTDKLLVYNWLLVVVVTTILISSSSRTTAVVNAYQTSNYQTIRQQQNVPEQMMKTAAEHNEVADDGVNDDHVSRKVSTINIPAVNSNSNNNILIQKVPFKYNNATIELVVPASMASAASLTASSLSQSPASQQQQQQYLQTPASVFFTQYTNQQNVINLIRNMEERLRNMKNVEMRVATIQEIFDSMHFSTSPFSAIPKNFTLSMESSHLSSRDLQLQQDLQYFSKRLANKLEKALHVVHDLREFFQSNITQIMQFTAEYEEDLEDEEEAEDEELNDGDDLAPAFDMELNDIEKHLNPRIKPLYLNTFILSCSDVEEGRAAIKSSTAESYNKQQIQILNYEKTDYPLNLRNYIDTSVLNENNELSMEANAYIKEKLRRLKASLVKNENAKLQPRSSWPAKEQSTAAHQSPGSSSLANLANHIKSIYFLSKSDDASDSALRFYNNLHFRNLFTSSIQQKYVFLLVDIGSGMSGELFELTKSYISNILHLLSPQDLISLVCVSDFVENMMLMDASAQDAANGLYLVTRERKEEILNYINSLSLSKTLTNHSLGFDYAFQMLSKLQNASLVHGHNPIEFVYVTRGLLTNFSDAMHILNLVAKGQRSLQKPIVINTCAVVLDEKRIMYEKQFLTDISSQNYTKYDIDVKDWYRSEYNLHGKLFILTKMQQERIIQAATAIFEKDFEEPNLIKTWQVHTPIVDGSSKDSIVSLTHAVPPFGVVGVDLYLSDLIEDILSYQQQQRQQQQQFYSNAATAAFMKNEQSYAFLIEPDGNTLAHPAFPRPHTQNQTPYPVDIEYLENSTDFSHIRQRILSEENGNATTTILMIKNRKQQTYLRSYQWHSILGIYILCMVNTRQQQGPANNNGTAEQMLKLPATLPLTLKHFAIKNNLPLFHQNPADYEEYLTSVDLIYHRLDLLPINKGAAGTQLCRYFRQLSTMDAATLFLSSVSFESPFTFLHNNRMSSLRNQLETVDTIMAYLKDPTGLIANPGLRPQIRQEVNALYNAMQHLKKRHQDSRGSLRSYIIRRYIASVNGVLQVYPGCLLNNHYDPSQRPWYRKAMQHPGKIIATEPYLDAAGSGYIITIAHTIFEGKANGLHNTERDQTVAIVALDLPYAYFYKLILDTTPLCQMYNIKCLLLDNEGYLIAHPTMLEPKTTTRNQRRPHEHITHKESYLTNDILNHKNLVRKLACANYQNRTLQRYYVFNTSLSEILSNVVHGERTKYAITLIKNTNIFAAVLNSTCDGGAFCPCSTIDRQCLNCKRMDQSDCECPCECPMPLLSSTLDTSDMQLNEDTLEHLSYLNITHQYQYCEPPYEEFMTVLAQPRLQRYDEELEGGAAVPSLALPSCLSINCDAFATQRECLAVMGCEWCQQDLEGNPFSAAFCSQQSSCYNGVLAGLSPYGDLDDADLMAAHGYDTAQNANSYSTFGPIAGAIVVLVIIIGLAVYCYRHNVDSSSQEQFYMDSMQEENYGLPLSRFNFDDCQAHDDPPSGAGGHNAGSYEHSAGRANLMNAADISPYHMSTGSSYRRPPNNESDHGYSTMTPHEDSSEHQCFTLAEPLLLNDKRNSKSDTLSISTSISSPTNRQQQQQQSHYSSFPTKDSTTSNKYNLASPTHKHQHHHHHHHQQHQSNKYQSPQRVYEQTTIPLHDVDPSLPGATAVTHLILAPVTVHRHMETSES